MQNPFTEVTDGLEKLADKIVASKATKAEKAHMLKLLAEEIAAIENLRDNLYVDANEIFDD